MLSVLLGSVGVLQPASRRSEPRPTTTLALQADLADLQEADPQRSAPVHPPRLTHPARHLGNLLLEGVLHQVQILPVPYLASLHSVEVKQRREQTHQGPYSASRHLVVVKTRRLQPQLQALIHLAQCLGNPRLVVEHNPSLAPSVLRLQ